MAEIERQHAEGDNFLKRLQAIWTDDMSEKDLLSHRVMEPQLQREDVNYGLKNYEMPVNQQSGVHTRLADLPLSVPFDSVPHYQDYISRLHQGARLQDGPGNDSYTARRKPRRTSARSSILKPSTNS